MSNEQLEWEKDHQIYEGDCLEIMDILIELGIRVDAIITDIPYGTTRNQWDAIIPFQAMWDRLNRIKKSEYTPILLFADDPFAAHLQLSNEKQYRYKWYWNKNAPTGFLKAAWQPLKVLEQIVVFIETPYKTLPSKESWKKNDLVGQFYPQYFRGEKNHSTGNKLGGGTSKLYGRFKTQNEIENEFIKSAPGKLGKNYGPKISEKHQSGSYGQDRELFNISSKFNSFRTDLKDKGEFDKHPINLIKFQKHKVSSTNGEMHSTEKPVDLLEYLVKSYTKEGELVLDFTAGSGSLMEACMNTNRRSISIEILPEHIAMIVKRYERLHWLKELEKN